MCQHLEHRCGVYGIIIDGAYIAYIGQSGDIYDRAMTHIYNIFNAIFLDKDKDWKYYLLNAMWMGGMTIDIVPLLYTQENVRDMESLLLARFKPILNIALPGETQTLPNNIYTCFIKMTNSADGYWYSVIRWLKQYAYEKDWYIYYRNKQPEIEFISNYEL